MLGILDVFNAVVVKPFSVETVYGKSLGKRLKGETAMIGSVGSVSERVAVEVPTPALCKSRAM